MAALSIQIPAFDDISGNWLCLDFTHTLTERYSPQPQELLNSDNDLVAWGLYERLLTDEEAQQLLREAKKHPEEASAALQRALELRETIYRVFYALWEGSLPEQSDLALLNERLAEAMSHARLVPDGGGFRWDWATNEQALDRIRWLLARSAADLLTCERLHDVRACAADDCKWLFLDTSKNHSRRWCDMQTCGNQAKARSHYSRKKDVGAKA
jgi:predicted RNA-binding Zn ribbon-like protein